MTSKAIVKCVSKWRGLALVVLALTLWQAGPASAGTRTGGLPVRLSATT